MLRCLAVTLSLMLGMLGCGAREPCSAPVKSVGGAPPKVQPYAPASSTAR